MLRTPNLLFVLSEALEIFNKPINSSVISDPPLHLHM